MEDADQAHIQPHVTMQNMAKLMSYNALQLIPRQVTDRAASNPDHGIISLITGGEGIDALLLQHINGGHWRSRGYRHLFNHIENAPLVSIAGIKIDLASTGLRPLPGHHALADCA